MVIGDLDWTGERFLPNYAKEMPEVAMEHLSRYFFAKDFCVDKAVLDVACGEGYGSYILAQTAQSVLGVDIAMEAVEHANQLYGGSTLSYERCDATRLKDLDRSFEIIARIRKASETRPNIGPRINAITSIVHTIPVSTPNTVAPINRVIACSTWNIANLDCLAVKIGTKNRIQKYARIPISLLALMSWISYSLV